MSLSKEYIKHGNLFFKYRTYVPLLIILPIIFCIYLFPDLYFTQDIQNFYLSIVISFTGQLIRVLTVGFTPSGTSGRNTSKQIANSLNTKGIYSIVRHPLYLGNYLIWLGFLIYLSNFYTILIFSIFYYFYYHKIMYAEEAFLINKFNEKYYNWSKDVASFIPNFLRYQRSGVKFSFRKIFIREYSNISGICIGFLLLSYAEYIFTNKKTIIYHNYETILICTMIFIFLCRFLKKGRIL